MATSTSCGFRGLGSTCSGALLNWGRNLGSGSWVETEFDLLYFLCLLETGLVRVGSIMGMVHGIETGV